MVELRDFFNMATHKANSYVRDFHMCSDIWAPFVREMLAHEQESWNPNYLYTVAIKSSTAAFVLHYFLLCTLLFHPSEQTCRNCTFVL